MLVDMDFLKENFQNRIIMHEIKRVYTFFRAEVFYCKIKQRINIHLSSLPESILGLVYKCRDVSCTSALMICKVMQGF